MRSSTSATSWIRRLGGALTGKGTPAESTVATVTVTNANPVVVDDNLVTNEDTPLLIDPVFDMTSNDTDADGDILALGTFAATSFNGGTVTLKEGIITYTPALGYAGLDGFTYTVTDGWGGTSAMGTVVITVNDLPEPAPGPMTLDVDLVGGNVTGTFTGDPGATYLLQRSTTLEGGGGRKAVPGPGADTDFATTIKIAS